MLGKQSASGGIRKQEECRIPKEVSKWNWVGISWFSVGKSFCKIGNSPGMLHKVVHVRFIVKITSRWFKHQTSAGMPGRSLVLVYERRPTRTCPTSSTFHLSQSLLRMPFSKLTKLTGRDGGWGCYLAVGIIFFGKQTSGKAGEKLDENTRSNPTGPVSTKRWSLSNTSLETCF